MRRNPLELFNWTRRTWSSYFTTFKQNTLTLILIFNIFISKTNFQIGYLKQL